MISARRGLVLVGKFTEGILSTLQQRAGRLYLHCKKKKKKKMGIIYVHLYKNEQKGFRPGGILSISHLILLQEIYCIL